MEELLAGDPAVKPVRLVSSAVNGKPMYQRLFTYLVTYMDIPNTLLLRNNSRIFYDPNLSLPSNNIYHKTVFLAALILNTITLNSQE